MTCFAARMFRVSPEETADSVEMALGMWSAVGPSNHVLDGGLDPPTGRGHFGVRKGPSHSKYRDNGA